MSRDAFQLLGLEPGASPAEIEAAFKQRVWSCHPDQGGDPARFHALKKARLDARSYSGAEPCPTCHGTGKQVQSRGWTSIQITCPTCQGTGKRHR